MKDEKKTQAQLIDELRELREEVKKLVCHKVRADGIALKGSRPVGRRFGTGKGELPKQEISTRLRERSSTLAEVMVRQKGQGMRHLPRGKRRRQRCEGSGPLTPLALACCSYLIERRIGK